MCGARIGVRITRGVGGRMLNRDIGLQWAVQAFRIRQQQVEMCLRRVGRGMTTQKDEQLLRSYMGNFRRIKK